MLQMRGHTCGSNVGLAFVLLGTLVGATICPIYIKTNTVEATTGTAVDSVLTFDGTNLSASLQLLVESPTGTFATSSAGEKATFSISTNNYTGYTLTMKSSGSNTNLGDNNSHNISTIESATTLETFSSSSSAGQALNNKWGYIPNYYNASGANPAVNTTNYYPAPTSSNVATLRTTSSANSNNGIDNADNYNIGLGLRVNYDTVSGTYANDTFLLEYVANPVTYVITYDKNTNDTVTDMPYSNSNNQQGGDALGSSITLSNAVPARADYDFLGWCFGTVSAVNGADTCSGTVYNPNGGGTDLTFGIDQTTTNTPTLYAMWERYYTLTFLTSNNATSVVFNGETFTNNQTKMIRASELTNPYHIYGNYATRYAFSSWTITAGTLGNQSYQNTTYTVTDNATITLTGQQVTTAIQNLPLSSCTTTAMPVYDTRDDSVYWIQELSDGNCWMLDNLALDLTDSTIVNALSTNNTHLDATALGYFKNGGGSASDRYPIMAYGILGSTDSYSQPLTNMDSKDITLRPVSANNYTNSVAGAYGQGQGKVGAYYNYCAASVGNYCFGDGASFGASSGDNDYDVCPAGWRMPSGGATGEYNALYATPVINSSATAYRNTLSTPLSGHFYGGSTGNLGLRGGFWSSTWDINSRMYDMNVDSNNVYPMDEGNRDYGSSVRCILAKAISDIEYMQDFATLSGSQMTDVLASMVEDQQYQLKDSRDEKPYYISKLADGNVWMTQNLDHDIKTDGSVTYDSTTTDITSAWSPSTATYATNDSTWNATASAPESYDPGDLCWSGTPQDSVTVACSQSGSHLHLGNYYNWTAAVAMDDSSSYTALNTSTDQSICPAGWTLPDDGLGATNSGSIYYLLSQYGWNTSTEFMEGAYDLWGSPLYLSLNGRYWNGSMQSVGSHGYLWSSRMEDATMAVEFFLRYDDNAYLNDRARVAGNSVRCLLRQTTTISDLEYMQDFATLTSSEKAEVLDSMTAEQQYQLKDNRDEKPYYISKLADGNVWMTQNLDHDIKTDGSVTYDSTTTDIPSTWNPSTATYATSVTTWDDTSTGYTSPRSYDPGDECWSGTLHDSVTVSCNQNGSHFHLGNFYNWTAAVAMNDSSSYTTLTDVDQSICPAGWTLPKDGSITSSGSFQYLLTQYGYDTYAMTGSYSVWDSPLFFPLSGTWSGGYLDTLGESGVYWLSVVVDSGNAYTTPYGYNGAIYPYAGSARIYGDSVRCVAR